MLLIVKNPNGRENFDVIEEKAALRVGERIKKVRVARKLSRQEFGDMIGLSADRVQKYENGARKPKSDMLKKMAKVLNVDPLVFIDPAINHIRGVMYALFELEEEYGMVISKTKTDEGPAIGISAPIESSLYASLKEWLDVYNETKVELESAENEEEKQAILEKYNNWKWNYPQGIIDRTSRDIFKMKVKQQIETLQDIYEKLDEEDKEREEKLRKRH